MELTVYRSLDRSVQFFGIKGRFLIPMGIGAVTSLITACMIGSATNGLAGIALFLILFFVSAMAVVALQGSIREKPSSGKWPCQDARSTSKSNRRDLSDHGNQQKNS